MRRVGMTNQKRNMKLRQIPPMTFCRNFQKLPGKDTSQFNNWPCKVQVNRKLLSLEVDKGGIKFIEKLIEVDKENELFE